MKPLKRELFRFSQVDFLEVTASGTVGIPVPGAMPLFAPGSQATLGTGKGKRARTWLIEPDIPGLRANLNRLKASIGIRRRKQVIIDHPGNSMACHTISAPLRCTVTDTNWRYQSHITCSLCYELRSADDGLGRIV